jgi:glycosyltransferase involved in cell wall biosynthesis
MPDETTNRGTSLAYIVSQYPMLSMIFIIREVLQLKNQGFNIDVASVNAADRDSNLLTSDEANESKLTYYIKPDGLTGALGAHLKTLVTNTVGYLRGLLLVFSLSGFDLNKLFFNLMYFTEACMTGIWMKTKGQTHLHAHLGSQPATVAMYVKKIFGFGYSITIHGPDEFYDAKGQYLTEKIQESDFICCISNFARSQLMKLSPYDHWHKLEVCRLGIDPSIFSPIEFEEEPAIFEVICVGRLSAAKGQHILVDAIAELIEKGRNVRLRIVGYFFDSQLCRRHSCGINGSNVDGNPLCYNSHHWHSRINS